MQDDDEQDLVLPHFQRVAISGEDTSGVSFKDIEDFSGWDRVASPQHRQL